MKLILIVFATLISFHLFSQSQKSEFYPEANGTVGHRTKVNAVGIRTPNTTAAFYKMLNKKYGKPKTEGYFNLYTCYNKNWSKNKIVIRVERSIELNLDGSKTNTIFIFVETENAVDLLKPGSPSSIKIKKYFLNLFKTTVENQKPDSFK